MERTADDILEGLKIATEEISGNMNDQSQSLVVLRETAKTFFTAASVLVSLVISFNLFFVKVDNDWKIHYLILSVLLIIAYVGFTIFSIKGLLPSPITKPFPADYKDLTESLCIPNPDRQAMILSSYLASMEYVHPMVVKKAAQVKWAAIMWGVMIIIIILLAAIPRVG
ncbi:MAG: hypothetical protein C0401_12500 [Anaerolinea sp.]|nr:hypothetical protein [Anaerolinea sp.]